MGLGKQAASPQEAVSTEAALVTPMSETDRGPDLCLCHPLYTEDPGVGHTQMFPGIHS